MAQLRIALLRKVRVHGINCICMNKFINTMPPIRIMNDDSAQRPAKFPRGVNQASVGDKREFFIYYSITMDGISATQAMKVKVNKGDEVYDIIKSIKMENSNTFASVDVIRIQLFKSLQQHKALYAWKEWNPNVSWGTKTNPLTVVVGERSFFVYYKVSVDGKLSHVTKINVNIGDEVDDIKKAIKMENSNTFASVDAIQIKISCKLAGIPTALNTLTKWDPNVSWGTKANPLIVTSHGNFERKIALPRSNIVDTAPPNQILTQRDACNPESVLSVSNFEMKGAEEDDDDEDSHADDDTDDSPLHVQFGDGEIFQLSFDFIPVDF